MEIWKDIIGYEGLYQVSNMGNVKSLDRWVKAKGNGKQFYASQPIKIKYPNNYAYVFIYKNNKLKSHRVHRLVAKAFLPNPNNYPFVMHMDNDPKNNCVENLQWGTNSMNQKHAVATGIWNNQYTI